ncbi:hypothetical protein A9X03_07110 [Mycobacterium sp. E1715]|uniref:CBS domain-containing protein n=1 Tax=Mycobacterium sp. E1715 TaxID=1856863 RepID=UPI000800E03B|nr:CBS domain-containing protein [Mycobacterium sp. E1715]OBH31702.1 hypothetical protein A9X03_07110 [Mycobacterium sp. E1715]
MDQIDGASRFLAAFNAIENHFKSRLGDDVSGFRGLAEKYADKFGMGREDRRAIRIFGELRNVMLHTEYYQGKPIAVPVPGIVSGIETLRDKILSPPTVLGVLPRRPIVRFSPGDPISAVLDEVRKHNYSQFPIYEGHSYCGLLTTNCVGRWLADRLATDELAESESVSAVLKFAEPQDTAAHLSRAATVLHAIKKLSSPAQGSGPPAALIITETGKANETPLAIVVADDLAILFAAA